MEKRGRVTKRQREKREKRGGEEDRESLEEMEKGRRKGEVQGLATAWTFLFKTTPIIHTRYASKKLRV